MLRKLLYVIIALAIPVVFLYPQGILYGTYLNYIYVIGCAGLLVLFRTTYVAGYSFRFYKYLFGLNLFANAVALGFGQITMLQFVSGNAPLLCAFCLSFIVSAWPSERLLLLTKMVKGTFLLVLLLIVLDGIWKPGWIYPLYYFQDSMEYENLFTFHHRAVGPLLSPVMAGFFCATLIAYCWVRLVYHKWSVSNTVVFVFSVLGLFLTASRTSMLALVIMFFFFFCFYKVRNKLGMICLALVAVVALSMSDLSFLDDTLQNLTSRNEQLSGGVFEGTGRSATFLSALRYKFDARCLLWGVGTAEYSIVEDTSFSLAHNGLLSIFLPFGVIGLYLHYRLYKHYLLFSDKKYINKTYLLFASLWIVLLLGTFFSADIPVSYFSVCLQAIVLAYADRQVGVKLK